MKNTPAVALAAKAAYPRASLAAAALILGERARVELRTKGRNWIVSVASASAQAPVALLGEFLNEALSHALRVRGLARERPFAAAVFARLRDKGFPAAPADPLEQLEPQVRLDREQETADLLARARSAR